MYRCSTCGDVSAPNQVLKKHIIYRANGSILREVAVCGECQQQLDAGIPLAQIQYKIPEKKIAVTNGHKPREVVGKEKETKKEAQKPLIMPPTFQPQMVKKVGRPAKRFQR